MLWGNGNGTSSRVFVWKFSVLPDISPNFGGLSEFSRPWASILLGWAKLPERNMRPDSPISGGAEHATIPTVRLAEAESTSQFLKRLAQTGQLHGRAAAVVADRQTAGVGRFGRAWSSPPGGLWYSLAWPLPTSQVESERLLDGLGIRVGVAVMQVIEQVVCQTKRPCEVRLKWPNDLMLNNRKVSGVLCELVSERAALLQNRYVVVGVGINANFSAMQLPVELRARACGLIEHVAEPVNLERLMIAVEHALIEAFRTDGLPLGVLRIARERLWGLDGPITVTLPNGQQVHGLLIGLDARGMAQVRTEDSIFTAPSGAMVMRDE